MSILVACDLDNTLIHSYRNVNFDKDNDICVYKSISTGKDTSFISKWNLSKFKLLKENVKFLPVTSRSIEQFEAITLFDRSDDAITTGGVYIRESGNYLIKNFYDYSYEELCRFRHLANQLGDKCKLYDNFCIVTDPNICEDSSVIDFDSSIIDPDRFNIIRDLKKLYILPKGVSKGTALESYLKYKKLNGEVFDMVIACGDSSPDFSMLDIADYAITTDVSQYRGNVIEFPYEGFTDYLLNHLLKMVGE